jgi:predicted nuclease of restriction endonuclease-like (RecB) superfamily
MTQITKSNSTSKTDLSIKNKNDFSNIFQMIKEAKETTWKQVNTSLISLYWNIGEYISNKVNSDGWGQSIVEELSLFILSQDKGAKGFSARNLWRMKQFYETYKDDKKLSTVLTEISWSNHLHILSKTKTIQEKDYYLHLCLKRPYSARDLARIIDSSTYERTALADIKLSTSLAKYPSDVRGIFKDIYVFDFLDIPEEHPEDTLKKALLTNFKKFLLEFGPDFTLIGEEYVIQVGMKDYRIDLLLHNRGINALIAIELKVTEFQPEYLGKLQFYLEALDRDVKKDHENPSIGILICKTKDEEVVEYALSRNVSPALISEYETKLIDRKLLQKKLHAMEYLLDKSDEN